MLPSGTGHPQPCADEVHRGALCVAERRKQAANPRTRVWRARVKCHAWDGGSGTEVRGRWNVQVLRFLCDLVRLCAQRALQRWLPRCAANVRQGRRLRPGPDKRQIVPTPHGPRLRPICCFTNTVHVFTAGNWQAAKLRSRSSDVVVKQKCVCQLLPAHHLTAAAAQLGRRNHSVYVRRCIQYVFHPSCCAPNHPQSEAVVVMHPLHEFVTESTARRAIQTGRLE